MEERERSSNTAKQGTSSGSMCIHALAWTDEIDGKKYCLECGRVIKDANGKKLDD